MNYMILGKPPESPEEMDLTLVGEGHIQAYRASGGEIGYIWNNATTLLLTTIGRSSGDPKTVALIFAEDEGRYIIIASLGGAPNHPRWYLNIEANPRVKVQVRDKILDAEARTAAPLERERLWLKAAKGWPQYESYQAQTSREIPVVILKPIS